MKRLVIKLSDEQMRVLEAETGFPSPTVSFGLLAQPYLPTKELRILVLTEAEFNRANKWMKRFIPRELRTPSPTKERNRKCE